MNAYDFLSNLGVIFAIMGLAALAELAVPLFGRTPPQQKRGAANLGLTVLTLLLNGALMSAAAGIALTMCPQVPGLMTLVGLPFIVQLIASIVVLDFFFGYLAHWAMHRSAILWRVHRVHHSDPFVDVTTTYRTHPIEVVWRFACLIVPIWILGVPPEAVLTYRLLSAINAILEHADIRLWQPLEALSVVWVTPNMHKVHHSCRQAETDSNYGNILAIHDRLLRTYTPTDRAYSVVYGLDDTDPARVRSLRGVLSMPFESAHSGSGNTGPISYAQKVTA